jgi:hypothetical protein
MELAIGELYRLVWFLWLSVELLQGYDIGCQRYFAHWLPLMGVHPIPASFILIVLILKCVQLGFLLGEPRVKSPLGTVSYPIISFCFVSSEVHASQVSIRYSCFRCGDSLKLSIIIYKYINCAMIRSYFTLNLPLVPIQLTII